jgi:DNA replication protein DnaC
VAVLSGTERPWRERWQCEACEAEAERQARRELRTAAARKRRADAGIPRQYHGLAVRDLQTWPVDLILAVDTWRQQGGGLYIHGPVGVGKSTAAAAAAWELLGERPLRWATASQLGRWALASFGTPEHDAAQRIAGGRGALVVDDFGQEPLNHAVAAVVRDAIQARIDEAAPLLLTSNLSISEACGRSEEYGQRLASRLAGYCHQVYVVGRDHRLDVTP